MPSATFMIAVSNGEATLPDQNIKCKDCRSDAKYTFLNNLYCYAHFLARELAEGI